MNGNFILIHSLINSTMITIKICYCATLSLGNVSWRDGSCSTLVEKLLGYAQTSDTNHIEAKAGFFVSKILSFAPHCK